MAGLGYSTYVRNSVWATEKSLWEDVRRKAPGLARPHQVVAAHYMRSGQFDAAVDLYKKALTLKHPSPRESQAHCLNNMGNIYLYQGDYAKALKSFADAQGIYPGHEKSLHNMALVNFQCGQWETSLQIADRLLAEYPEHVVYLNLKGFILNKLGRPLEAKIYLLRAMQMAPNDRNAAVNLSISFSLAGHYGQAQQLLKQARQFYPRDITIQMGLVENSLRANDENSAGEHLKRLSDEFRVNDIIHYLKEIIREYHTTPLSAEILVPAVSDTLRDRSKQLKTLCLLENPTK
jgi:Flp pilus assembly protein TadD